MTQPAAPYSATKTATPTTTSSSSSGHASASRVQAKSFLRGLDFATQLKALTPVQRSGEGYAAAAVHEAAAAGTRGSGGALPHGERIQSAFGRHDVSAVQAHVGGAAREATERIGASAYASGDHVAFGGQPDLHTAAHEAAHVIQQRQGVSLDGGVGRAGDPYERHADAVADAVVQGEPAEGLLDAMAPGGGGGAVQRNVVQREESEPTTESVRSDKGSDGGGKATEVDEVIGPDAGDELDPSTNSNTSYHLGKGKSPHDVGQNYAFVLNLALDVLANCYAAAVENFESTVQFDQAKDPSSALKVAVETIFTKALGKAATQVPGLELALEVLTGVLKDAEEVAKSKKSSQVRDYLIQMRNGNSANYSKAKLALADAPDRVYAQFESLGKRSRSGYGHTPYETGDKEISGVQAKFLHEVEAHGKSVLNAAQSASAQEASAAMYAAWTNTNLEIGGDSKMPWGERVSDGFIEILFSTKLGMIGGKEYDGSEGWRLDRDPKLHCPESSKVAEAWMSTPGFDLSKASCVKVINVTVGGSFNMGGYVRLSASNEIVNEYIPSGFETFPQFVARLRQMPHVLKQLTTLKG